MSAEMLREGIRALLNSHPAVAPSRAGHTVHLERYRTAGGANIGFEPERIRHQNLYVEASAVRLGSLSDIRHQLYWTANYQTSRPNHHLFHKDAFGEVDIIRFEICDLWQSARVIAEVAGLGGVL